MSGLVWILLAVLTVWMIGCAYCGYKRRIRGFLIVLVAGILANVIWMTVGLDARRTEPHVLMALVAGAFMGHARLLSGCWRVVWCANGARRRWTATGFEITSVSHEY